eukprot:511377_1
MKLFYLKPFQSVMDTLFVFQFFFNCISTTIMLTLQYIKYYNMYRIDAPIKASRQKYNILAMIFYLISTILFIFLAYLHWIHSDNFSSTNAQTIDHIFIYKSAMTAWILGTFFGYFAFMNRLISVFKDTALSLSTRMISTFYSLIFFYLIISLISIASYILYNFNYINLEQFEICHLIIVIFQEIDDLILTIFLIKIFVNKLTAVMIALSDTYQKDLTIQQIRLINVIIKYNILAIPAILSTQIALIIDWIFIVITLITNSNNFQNAADTYYLPFVWVIEMLINTICLFLSTSDTKMWYDIVCSRFHNRCMKNKMKKAKEDVNLAIKGLEELDKSLLSIGGASF